MGAGRRGPRSGVSTPCEEREARSVTESAKKVQPMDLWPEKKRAFTYLLVFVGALFLGLLSSFFYERSAYRGRVARGVEWSEHPVSGLSGASLKTFLASRSDQVGGLSIELALGEKRRKFKAEELGISLDVRSPLKKALSVGREGSVARELGFWCARLFSVYEIPATVLLDEEKLKQTIQPWAMTLLLEPELPSLSYDKQLKVTPGRGGTVIEYPTLRHSLRDIVLDQIRSRAATAGAPRLDVPTKVRAATISRDAVEATVQRARALLSGAITVTVPDGNAKALLSVDVLGAALSSEVDEGRGTLNLQLSIEPLRKALTALLKEWEHPAVPAEFEFSRSGAPVISDSETGRALDEERLKDALLSVNAEGPRRIILPLKDTEPELTTSEAKGLRVKGLVMSFTTRHPCCQPRVENIHHAAKRLDGVVLRPGEKFSLNDFLGPRREASGYRKAPTIVRGEMEDVYGGGISQLATTLFNAVLRGGYEIIQRQPHSVYFARYPEGHEATVSYPEPDLIFRNDTEAGMVLKTNAAPTFISVHIYGDNGGRVTTVDKGRRYNIAQPPKEYEPDEGMSPEKVKRLRAGQLGWTVLVSRTVEFPDGEQKVEKREVVYNPRPELLRVHPCMIPEGEKGHTGEDCPESEIEEEEEELSEDTYFETQ